MILFSILLIYCSCNQSNVKDSIATGDIKDIKVPDNQSGTPKLDDLIRKVEIVPLETTNESIFKSIDQLIYQNKKIFIHDMDLQELYVFDLEGSFLFRLNQRGRGPQEYQDMRDVDVDKNGDIYVLTTNSLVIYDELGEFIDRIVFSLPKNHHINPSQFAFAGVKGFYLWSGSLGIKEQIANQYAVYKINRKGEFINEAYFPVNHKISGGPRFSRIDYEDNYTMTPATGSYIVYKFSPNEVIPTYEIDFEKRRLPATYLSGFENGKSLYQAFESTDFVVDVIRMQETQKYIFFADKSSNTIWVNFYSKGTENILRFDYLASSSFFPAIHGRINDHTFIGHLDTHILIEGLEDGIFEKYYGSLFHSYLSQPLELNDNPVLVLLRLKEDF